MSEFTTKILQNQYNEICKSLGDAYYKQTQLKKHIKSLEAQLEYLNSQTSPIASMVEKAVNDDLIEVLKSQQGSKRKESL